ncbi:MAG TPA: DEAD/DEAH box helicase [Candidatus Aphodovivens avistercoris]|nr:DEAD/DEAH box helicase [Candidatus Aphodovivens avistercoris]
MTSFAELGLSDRALEAVERLGYENPTPVQEQAIPYVLEGRDLIAAASTGTGKTAAFLLPAFSQLAPKPRGKESRGRAPRVLVVSPTRELAQQSSRVAMKISRCTRHFVTTVFGGTPYGPQIRELRDGTDVLIATPGRLKDLMARGVVKLDRIEVLVLDEADRMLDMGFLPDVTEIVAATPDERQTLLFSATIDESIQNNLGTLLRDPAVVEIARNGETAKSVAQFLLPIKNPDKPALLRAVLEEKGHNRVIVFARTKTRTEECAQMLCEAGYQAESIHSDKSQGQRRRALANFRNGKTDILVATDVLARGIDVTGVDYVVNFDLPDMPEDYIHRIGRTGRAGEKGFAISFATRETRRTLAEIVKLIGQDIPFMELENYETDPSVLEKPQRGKKRAGASRSGKQSARPKRGGRGFGEGGPNPAKRSGAPRAKREGDEGGFLTKGERRDGGRRGGKKAGTSRGGQAPTGKKAAKARRADAPQKRSGKGGGYDYSRFVK